MDAEDRAPIEIRAPLHALIAGLARPGALVPDVTAEVVETHISVVFLAGERAWKIKKPVRLWDLVDYGTFERRRQQCVEEVRLNRRLAPSVYRGVVPVTGDGETFSIGGSGAVVEHAVEMMRLPPGATLGERVADGRVTTQDVVAVGETLAAFHAANRIEDPRLARNALPARFAPVLRRNFGGSIRGVPDPFVESVHEGLRVRMIRRLAIVRERIRARVRAGRIVDGHGDVRLEHVVFLTHGGADGPAVIDACEFSPRLRHIDPLSDAAFLAMDLTLHGRPDLAAAYERAYLGASSEPDARLLLPLYRAYRAHVRAMVEDRSARDPARPEAGRRLHDLAARRCLALAWSYARTGAVPPIVVMRGAAGTGKSVLATALAPWLLGEPIRSDVVRKELLGMDVTERPDAQARRVVYGGPMHARTYAALLERARTTVRAGRAALLDATYLRRTSREEVRALARELGAPYAILDLRCPPDVVRERLQARMARDDDASDADWAVYEAQAAEAEPVAGDEAPFLVSFRADQSPEEVVLPLLQRLESQVSARAERLAAET